jgi:hypothetical protein
VKLYWEVAHPNARQGTAAELVVAADQFIINSTGRGEDTARIRASGGKYEPLSQVTIGSRIGEETR